MVIHAGSRKMKSDESVLTKSDWTLTSFYSLTKFPTEVRRSTAMMKRFVKNGTDSKFWLIKITGPPPDGILNILVRRNRLKFQEIFALGL